MRFLANSAVIAATLLLGGARAADGVAATPRVVVLSASRVRLPGESASVRLSAGVLPHGSRLIVRLANGELVGAISPFGVSPGERAGSYMIPLPEDAVRGGTVTLHLELELPDHTLRTPTEKEIEGGELLFQ